MLHFRNLQSEAIHGPSEHIESLIRIIELAEIKITAPDLVKMIQSSQNPPELIQKIKSDVLE